MVATATRTLLENLDRIPDEGGRTKVAIICFDVALYFFSMTVSGRLVSPKMSLMRSAAWLLGVVYARSIRH